MSDFTPLRQTRGVDATITHTFEYYRSRFKSIAKALLIILGPIVGFHVFLSALGRIFYPEFFSFGDTEVLFESMQGSGGLLLIVTLSWLAIVAALVVIIPVLYGYLRLDERMDDGALPTPSQVWAEARQHLASVVFGGLLWYFVWIIGTILMTIPIMLFGLPFGEIGMAVLAVVGLIGAATFLGVRLCMFFPAIVIDQHGPISAFSRSWNLTKGAFWRTFGISVIAGIIVGTASALLSLPSQFGGGLGMLFDMNLTALLIVFDVVGAVGTYLAYPIFYMALGFHYYSQVERHEYEGLEQRIEALDGEEASLDSREIEESDPFARAPSDSDDDPFRNDR